MRFIRLLTITTAVGLFLMACNQNPPQQQSVTNPPYPNDAPIAEDDYWAKDNFNLERVGNLLEESDSPEEFEEYLNREDGINNLDLNGDGYVDYISVDEFEDRDSNSRGLSLFTRFGPDIIQEIATIFFYRDRPDYPGARILLAGNENIYGDNYYYETNWLDRTIGLASLLFSDRDDYYRSPYYYDNYPPDYVAYEVVDTPIYVTRVQRLYPEPVFVYTAAPTYISNVKIKSPHSGKSFEKIYAKLAKPTKGQEEFIKSAPPRARASREDKGDRGKRNDGAIVGDDKPGRDDPPRSDRGEQRGNPARDERGAQRGNPSSPPAGKPDRPNEKPSKADNPGQGQGPAKAQGQGQGKGGQSKGGGQGKGKKP